MPRVRMGKLRLLYIMEMLLLKSDENHRISTPKLLEMLEERNIFVERKSIYDDIETLNEFGIEIMHDKNNPPGYFVLNRIFELPELRLLIDAVQSSKIITTKKTISLVNKILGLTCAHEARELQKQAYVVKRGKCMNETIYYNVDTIHEALQTNSKISFQYMTWTLEKELVPKYDNDIIVSPWALTWDDGYYYMLAHDETCGIIKRYRVDKIMNTRLRKDRREGAKAFEKLDMSHFSKKSFGLYNGKTERITLECNNHLIGPILDRFGRDLIIVPAGESKFRVTCQVIICDLFYGWLVGLGPGARIVYPESIVNDFKDRVTKMI